MSTGDRTDGLLTFLTEGMWRRYQEVDPRSAELADAEIVGERVRHSLGSRVSHWLQVALMAVLIVTGYALWSGNYGPMNVPVWDGYYVAFGLHIWTGIFVVVVSLVLFPFYHVLVDGHGQMIGRIDLVLAVHILLAFVGIREYPEHYHDGRRAWDAENDHWMVGHPAQKAFFWGISLAIVAVAITGFGMYAAMATDPVWWITWLGFSQQWLGPETLKQLHLVVSAVVAAMILMHTYFAVVPSNWDVLRSMILGRLPYFEISGGRDDRGTDFDG